MWEMSCAMSNIFQQVMLGHLALKAPTLFSLHNQAL